MWNVSHNGPDALFNSKMAIEFHRLALPFAYQTSQKRICIFIYLESYHRQQALLRNGRLGNWQDQFLGQSVVILWLLTFALQTEHFYELFG